jgi:hypothetical protein
MNPEPTIGSQSDDPAPAPRPIWPPYPAEFGQEHRRRSAGEPNSDPNRRDSEPGRGRNIWDVMIEAIQSNPKTVRFVAILVVLGVLLGVLGLLGVRLWL